MLDRDSYFIYCSASGPKLHGRVASQFLESSKKQFSQTTRVKDRKDRATVEQVLDPRTKMILFKLLNKGVISEINGCISTGWFITNCFNHIK